MDKTKKGTKQIKHANNVTGWAGVGKADAKKSTFSTRTLTSDFQDFQPSFYFNVMDNIRENKGQWIFADGSPSELFT